MSRGDRLPERDEQGLPRRVPASPRRRFSLSGVRDGVTVCTKPWGCLSYGSVVSMGSLGVNDVMTGRRGTTAPGSPRARSLCKSGGLCHHPRNGRSTTGGECNTAVEPPGGVPDGERGERTVQASPPNGVPQGTTWRIDGSLIEGWDGYLAGFACGPEETGADRTRLPDPSMRPLIVGRFDARRLVDPVDPHPGTEHLVVPLLNVFRDRIGSL